MKRRTWIAWPVMACVAWIALTIVADLCGLLLLLSRRHRLQTELLAAVEPMSTTARPILMGERLPDNAATHYEQALAGIARALRSDRTTLQPLTEEVASLHRHESENASFCGRELPELVLGLRSEVCEWTPTSDESEDFAEYADRVQAARLSAYCLVQEGDRERRQGSFVRASQYYLATMRFGGDVALEDFGHWLLGAKLAQFGLTSMISIETSMPDQASPDLPEVLALVTKAFPPVRGAIRKQRLTLIDHVGTEQSNAVSAHGLPALLSFPYPALAAYRLWQAESLVARAEQAAISNDPRQRRTLFTQLNAELAECPSASLRERGFDLWELASALATDIERRVALIRTMWKLERFKQANGRYPLSLREVEASPVALEYAARSETGYTLVAPAILDRPPHWAKAIRLERESTAH